MVDKETHLPFAEFGIDQCLKIPIVVITYLDLEIKDIFRILSNKFYY